MDFDLSEEQRAVATMAEELFADHGGDEHLKGLAAANLTWDEGLWQRLRAAGLFTLALPAEDGGAGLGMLEFALAIEQQGRHLAAAPWWPHHLATLALARFGAPALRARLLAEFAAGRQPCSLVTEVVAPPNLRARPVAAGVQLDGMVPAVPLDLNHRHLLIPVTTGDTGSAARLALIPANLSGVTRVSGLLTDLQPVHDLHFEGARTPFETMLDAAALPWLDARIALCVAAQQLGVLGEALQRTARFTSERQQFGRPLATFQALALRAADAYIEVELLRSTVWQLAWRLDQNLPAEAAARVAKLHAARAGHVVGHTVQHLHGGIGTDLTYPIHRFFLKSQALALIGGGHEAQLARIGAALADQRHEDYLHE